MTTPELLGCPFCSTPLRRVVSKARSFNPPRDYIYWHHDTPAVNCYLYNKTGHIVASTADNTQAENDFIAAWNSRSVPPLPVAGEEMVERAYDAWDASTGDPREALRAALTAALASAAEPATPVSADPATDADLSHMLRDAFLAGRGLKDGDRLSAEDQAAWMAYDPERMNAYKRIRSALVTPVSAEPVAFKNGPVALGYRDAEHLKWIADRLQHVHGENPNYDYMLKLREIATAALGAAPSREGQDHD